MSSERLLHVGGSVGLVLALAFLGDHIRSCMRGPLADSMAPHLDANVKQTTPRHVALFCPMHRSDEECPAKDRVGSAAAWVKDAVHRPSSTFCIRMIGDRRDDVRSFFCACTPSTWGANVLAAKASFIQETQRRAGEGLDARPASLGCDTGLDAAAYESDVVVLGPHMPPSLHRLADELTQPQANEPQQPLHAAIVCDMSPSYAGALSCRPETALMAFDALAAGSGAAGGSTLNLYLVNAGQAPPRSLFHLTIDSTMSRSNRIALVLGARNELPAVLRAAPPDNASAIAEAFPAAVFDLRQHPGRYALVFLSDLREYNGTFNLERAVPDAAVFADYLRAKGLWADANGIVVRGCGLHNQGGAPVGKAVNDLWIDVLRQQGATDPSFFSSCDANDLSLRGLWHG